MRSSYQTIELFVILCGGLVKTPDGGWRTTMFDDAGDDVGVLGDRLRIDAGGYVCKDFPNARFVVSGGKGHLQIDPEAPTMAPIMKKELIALGVPALNIQEDTIPNSTFEQLQALQRYDVTNIGIISNEYHLPRVQAMFEHFAEFEAIRKKITITYISAEKICLEHDHQKWNDIIARAYESEAMKKRIVLEQKGITDIKSGTYKV